MPSLLEIVLIYIFTNTISCFHSKKKSIKGRQTDTPTVYSQTIHDQSAFILCGNETRNL